MTICGIELSGSEVRLVLLSGTKEEYTLINSVVGKIVLADDANQNEVKDFRDAIFSFLSENNVTDVVIKKRSKKGTFSGGPVGFKLEGIIQLYDGCSVSLIAPQTISAANKKNRDGIPSKLKKYQYTAFEAAFSKLS